MPEQPKIIIQGEDRTGAAFRSVHGSLLRLVAHANAAAGRMTSIGNVGRMALGIVAAPLRLLLGVFGALSGTVGTVFRLIGSLAGMAGNAIGALVGVIGRVAGALTGMLTGAARAAFVAMSTAAKVGVAGMVAALAFLGRRGVGVNLELGSVERGLTVMLRSRDAARGLVEAMRNYAEQSVSTFRQIAGWGRSLIAFGFGARMVIPMLRTLGDTAAGLSMDAGGVQRLILALGQIKAKGMVSGEEAMQLMEAGIPVRRYLGVPEGKEIAAMGIPAMEGIRRILAGMQRDFGGMQAGAMRTLTGIWSNMMDAVDRLSAKVTTGLVGGLELAGSAALDFLGNLDKTRSGQVILQGLQALFTGIGNGVAGLAARLPQVADLIARAFESGKVQAFFGRLVTGVRAGIGWLWALGSWVMTNWPALWGYAVQVWQWLLGALRGGMAWIARTWATVWNGAIGVLEKVVPVVAGVVGGLVGAFRYFFDSHSTGMKNAGENLRGFASDTVAFLAKAAQAWIGLQGAVATFQLTLAVVVAAATGNLPKLGLAIAGLAAIPVAMSAAARGVDRMAGALQEGIRNWQGFTPAMAGMGERGGVAGAFGQGAAAWSRAAQEWFSRSGLARIGAKLGLPELPELTPLPTAPRMPGFGPAPAVPQTPEPVAPRMTYVPSRQWSPEAMAEDEARYRRATGQAGRAGGDPARSAADHLRAAAAALDRLPEATRKAVWGEVGRMQEAVT